MATKGRAEVEPARALVAAIVAALLERKRAAATRLAAPRSPWRMAGRQRALRPR